jgi:hypothetical protein
MTTRIYPRDQVFLAIYHFDSHALSTTDATLEEPDSEASADMCLDDIPPKYRDLAAVFSKANTNKLPPHRGHLDHSIPLERDQNLTPDRRIPFQKLNWKF